MYVEHGMFFFVEPLGCRLRNRLYMKEDVCWSAFRVFDRNGDGKISKEELRQVAGIWMLRSFFRIPVCLSESLVKSFRLERRLVFEDWELMGMFCTCSSCRWATKMKTINFLCLHAVRDGVLCHAITWLTEAVTVWSAEC